MTNTSSVDFHANTSTEPSFFEITASNVSFSLLLLLIFLGGLVVNFLYLWVLKFRMEPSINNVWLLHLTVANLVFILLLPILAVRILIEPHWIFGVFMCKVFNSMISLCLFASGFLVTGVSLNRYLLVFCPHWYIEHVRLHNVSAVCFGLWALAFLCSSPYLLFRVVEEKGSITICYNDYTLSGKWEDAEVQVKWGMYIFRILVGFLLPSIIITVCHFKILFKIKKNQRRRSTKTYKVIYLATATFFICWIPYHLAYGINLESGQIEVWVLLKLKIASACVYSCISPMCYLFIIEDFTKQFRKFIHL